MRKPNPISVKNFEIITNYEKIQKTSSPTLAMKTQREVEALYVPLSRSLASIIIQLGDSWPLA